MLIPGSDIVASRYELAGNVSAEAFVVVEGDGIGEPCPANPAIIVPAKPARR